MMMRLCRYGPSVHKLLLTCLQLPTLSFSSSSPSLSSSPSFSFSFFSSSPLEESAPAGAAIRPRNRRSGHHFRAEIPRGGVQHRRQDDIFLHLQILRTAQRETAGEAAVSRRRTLREVRQRVRSALFDVEEGPRTRGGGGGVEGGRNTRLTSTTTMKALFSR